MLIIHNDIDADDDDEDDDNDEDDDEPSVPLEQYRAWLGELQTGSFSTSVQEFFLSVCVYLHLFSALDEDSNLATSPMPDMDSDSMLGGPVDEEERWLDALEKGELDDNGELKKEVDESLLTARQVKKMDRPKRISLSYLKSTLSLGCVCLESTVTQAAEPAIAGAPHGLQGERIDCRDDAKTRGTGPKETPAGRQEGRGEQKPDHREADQNQQGQNQKHEREEVQTESVSHDPLQRLCSGHGCVLPRGSPRSSPGTSSPRAGTAD